MRARIKQNLDATLRRIADAAARAGRSPDEVRLVAITKSVSVDAAQALCEFGVKDLGENRVAAAREKIEGLGLPVRWHMVGNIQRRKCKDIAALFDCVDSVSRVEVAEALQHRCEDAGKQLRVLIEVNVSGESTKHGLAPENLGATLERVARMPNLTVDGLMTMAPLYDDPELARPVFADLRKLGNRFNLKELSMGMTNDFEVAVEEGATQVRIGTALFR
ncbi:MAG TPA: YggS family pyridoxal phosphate-dependent enzyme [Candidatus Hydrogenedentes bacterium]|nr:YggS family pyridoxal phosphate-dependent enzyme [Candidatus Hydrogenedentota bacterium]HIJ72545.1 YggS family pyridoxal phosphate-dependent enzyme [Candidatus Hydrogenedentota bacterium]